MRILFLLILAILFPSTPCFGQTKLTNAGFAVFNLTANRFNCSGFMSSMDRLDEWHIAFLYNTFGNNFDCLEQILKNPKLKTLEIALLNEPGHRNKRLGSYEFLRQIGSVGTWQKLVANNDSTVREKFLSYVKPLREFLSSRLRDDVELLINPGLESNLSDSAGINLVSWARDAFPNARIVWNPLNAQPGRRSKTKADFIEGHGASPNLSEPCVYNMDGTDVSYKTRPALGEPEYKEGQNKNWVKSGRPLFQLIETYSNRCEIALVWVAESNGLDYKIPKFVDPRKRNNFIATSVYRRIIQDIVDIHSRGIVYPKEYSYDRNDLLAFSGCTQILENFVDGEKRGALLKQSEFPDRGAVLILPKSFSGVRKVTLLKGTTVVDSFSSNGLYKDGRLLFRSNKSPTTYPFNTALVIEKNNSKICYKITNPRIRLD